MWVLRGDRSQRQLMMMFFLAIRSDFFRSATFYEKLLLHSKPISIAVTSSTQKLLFRGRYFFRTLTSYQQLFFQNSYLFGTKLLPTTSINF